VNVRRSSSSYLDGSELEHDGSVSLESVRNLSRRDAQVAVEPEITDISLSRGSGDLHFLECGFDLLRCRGTVPENDNRRAVRLRAAPDFEKVCGRLDSEALSKRAESLVLRVVDPTLIVATIAGISLDDRALVVPDIDTEVAVETRCDLTAIGVLHIPHLVL